jgi:hypothetical protein
MTLSCKRYVLSTSVRMASDGEHGYLLDVRSGRYYRVDILSYELCEKLHQPIDMLSLVAQAESSHPQCNELGVQKAIQRLQKLGLCREIPSL